MSDIGGIKNALTGLSALLPRVPESLAALAEAQAALSEAAEQFLATVEARQVEAAELFPRLEIALTGLSREAADGTAQAEQDRDLQERLQDPDLSFDERVSHFTTLLGEKQEQRIRHMARALGTAAENAATLQSGRQSLHEGLLDGRRRVAGGADV
ncbi:MAG TPA: hypothetical protein VFO85_12490, partial [Vicinamibacteria bacterium]|nr:hypothetical protein [Vicinamibacteria bacterium]